MGVNIVSWPVRAERDLGANPVIGNEDGKTEAQDQGQWWKLWYPNSSYILFERVESRESI